MSGRFGSLTDEGKFAETYFHQPLEVVTEESVYQEDVEGALMVGYKYVGSVLLHVRISLDLDWQEQCITEDVRPNFPWPIAPEVGIAEAATDDDGGTHEDCRYQKNG